MAKFAVRPDGHGSFTVELDGVDVSKHITTVDLHVEAGLKVPVVELGITVFEVEGSTPDNARIVLTPGTDDLLKQLGWTPPAEETP